MKIVWTDDVPICPYCEGELATIHASQDGAWERHTVYSCEHCHKVLGVGNDTGHGA